MKTNKTKKKAPPGVHVVPLTNGRRTWGVEIGRRVIHEFKTQRHAIWRARVEARDLGAELFIHGRDGKIRRRDSHGRDPRPPRGSRG
jgi:hypothetical protein